MVFTVGAKRLRCAAFIWVAILEIVVPEIDIFVSPMVFLFRPTSNPASRVFTVECHAVAPRSRA